MAKVFSRRAEHAATGYVLSGPDEVHDVQYQRDHGDTIRLAHRTGRCRHADDTVA